MKKNFLDYNAPEMGVIVVNLEAGFAQSGNGEGDGTGTGVVPGFEGDFE